MDDIRFVLVAWLMVMIMSEDERPKTFIKKLGLGLYFVGFAGLFLASFAIPQIRDAFIWFALYPLILQVVRFAMTKITESTRYLFKREATEEEDDAAV